jgi:hypothetical protein
LSIQPGLHLLDKSRALGQGSATLALPSRAPVACLPSPTRHVAHSNQGAVAMKLRVGIGVLCVAVLGVVLAALPAAAGMGRSARPRRPIAQLTFPVSAPGSCFLPATICPLPPASFRSRFSSPDS